MRVTVHQIEGSEAFAREVLQSEMPVVVDFYAAWCAPCHQVSPVIEALSLKWEGAVRFAKVDVDRDPQVAADHYGARNLRLWQVILVWILAMDLLIMALYKL